MIYKVFGVYSPDILKKVALASIEAETEISALRTFQEYVIKRCKDEGRKFAKNYTLQKDRSNIARYTIFTIGANTLGGVSLWLVSDTDYSKGKTIAKIPFPAKVKSKKKGAK